MRIAGIQFALIVSVLVTATAQAQVAREAAKEIDPVAVSPGQYRVLLENQQVRVVEYTVLPGQRDEWHTHPPKITYVVKGGTLKMTTEDGQSFVLDQKVGAASWADAAGRHFGENVGSTSVQIIFVEVKGGL